MRLPPSFHGAGKAANKKATDEGEKRGGLLAADLAGRAPCLLGGEGACRLRYAEDVIEKAALDRKDIGNVLGVGLEILKRRSRLEGDARCYVFFGSFRLVRLFCFASRGG